MNKYRSAPLRKQSFWLYDLLKPWEKHRLQKVGESIQGKKLRILEIGCAAGEFLYEYRHRWQKITGVDIDGGKLVKARRRNYGAPAVFLKADFGRKSMPFGSGQFDIVISIATLQYVYDLELLFEEIHRVLKKNGQLIFEVPNAAVFWRRWQFLSGSLPRTSEVESGWDAGVIHYFTCRDLEKFIQSCGFKIDKINCSGILDNIREYWVSLLGADLIFYCTKI